MPSPWLYLDAALERVGCDRQELTRACRDGDVEWRARDARGDLLESPYKHLWSGRVDWEACPPRFAMDERYFILADGRPHDDPRPPVWCVVEVERRSLLAHFSEPEPLAVRVVGPVNVWLHGVAEKLAGLAGTTDRRQRRGRPEKWQWLAAAAAVTKKIYTLTTSTLGLRR